VHPHNIFLSVIVDYGLVGLGLLVWTGLILWRRWRFAFDSIERPSSVFAVALFGMVVAIAANGLVDNDYNEPYFWLSFGLAMAALNRAQGPAEQPGSLPS
jgi:O-antigen ligase